MYKIIQGVGIITLFYLGTLWIAFRIFHSIYNKPFDHDWDLSGNFISVFMITIPYIVYGLFIRYQQYNPIRHAFKVSIVTVICERVSIYLIGIYFSSNGYGSREPMQFIRGEAAPYFTPFYIFVGGLISVILCVLAAWIGRVRAKVTTNN